MRLLRFLASALHALTALLFICAALVLIAIAARLGWESLVGALDRNAAQQLMEAMSVLAAAVVALQIAQTIGEEEVVRNAHVSGPTRVRRFLSRFLVVVVVALAIEALVATFKASHEGADGLLQAAGLVLSIGALLAGWGLFVRLNCAAEALEPEAMEEAKNEDEKLQ